MSGEIKPVLSNHLPSFQQPSPLNSAQSTHITSATSSTFPSDTSGYPPDSAHSYTSNPLVKQQQLSPTSLTHSHHTHSHSHSHSLSHSTTHSQPPSNTLPLSVQPQPQAPVPVDDSMSSTEMKKSGSTGPDKAKPHLCNVCNRGFTTGGHLQRHQRIHTGVKAFKCPFPGCETRTSRQDNLQQHYRTHLSPTLRRGSGSAARAAVNQAMEAAGLKSTSTRAPRKSKSSTNGTPSSNTSASTSHIPSPYATPTSQNGHYGYPQMYDPQQYAYPVHHPPPPGLNLGNTTQTSATSSRGPSPANGHSSGHSSVSSMPGSQPPHHQSYYPQPFPPAYPYYPQYRYPPPGAGQMMGQYGPPGPPGPPPHTMYSPGIAPDHAQGQMYSPIGSGFGTHSRESSYSGVMPGYGPGPSPMGNGYPRHNSTGSLHPISAPPSGDRSRLSPPRRRSPPDLMGQGVVDPNTMGRSSLHMSYGPNGTETNGVPNGYAHSSAPSGPGSGSGPSGHPHLSAYAFGQQSAPGSETLARGQGRASISSLSDGGSGGGSEGSGGKHMQ